MKKAFAFIIILLTALSCQKVEVNCVYTVRVFVQERQGSDRIPAENVKVYAFGVNPAEWKIDNIADARQGVITSMDGSRTLDNPQVAVQVFDTEEGETAYNGKYRFETPFTQQNIMLVVAHETQDIFAFGNANLQYNLDKMEVTLVLELFRTDRKPYTQGLWEIHNVGTKIPVNCAYTITSMQRRVDENTVSPVPLNSARLHVMYLDENDEKDIAGNWEVASYNDAVNGTFTNKSNPTEKRQASQVEIEYNANKSVATITQSKAVLVVYDTAQPMYGYAAANLENNPEAQTDEVTFTPYKPLSTDIPSGKERWTVKKENTYVSTLLTVSPKWKESDAVSDVDALPLTTTKGYAFYADTTEWNIASYEDAISGTITAKEGGQTRGADIEGAMAKYNMRIGFEMTQEEGHDKVLVVICDTDKPMYALGIIETATKRWPETISETVIFRPYMRNDTIPATGNNIWEIRNGDTAPEEPPIENAK